MMQAPRESTLHEPFKPRKAARLRNCMLCWCAVLTPIVGCARTITYEVAVDRELTAAVVDACFGATVPASLAFNALLPPAALSGMTTVSESRGGYRARNTARGCAHYALDLSVLPNGDLHSGFQRHGDAVLLDPTWLLAVPTTGRHLLEVHFVLPRGFRISAPAEVVPVTGSRVSARWRVRLSTRGWQRGGTLAIGPMTHAPHAADGTSIAIDVIGRSGVAPHADYVRWLQEMTTVVGTHFGRFPLPFAQLLVVLVAPDQEAVPWGEVRRAGGDGLVLFVDRTRMPATLSRDWVAYHELAHFVHPYLTRADSWWAEGLASYYQNVLRARSGALTPRAAWHALNAGFERGRQETGGRATLAEDSRDMRRTQRFMRVYWSGAAIALRADIELRLRSAGAQSLTRVLARFAQCCLPAEAPWSARDFMRKLDSLSGIPIMESLLAQYLDDRAFPDLAPLYDVLDLRADGDQLAFGGDPAGRRLREAIMGSEGPAN